MEARSMEHTDSDEDLKKFKHWSIVLGSLAFSPFGFILLMSVLNTFGYYLPLLFFVGLCSVGVIGFIIIAYAEVKLIWKYLGNRVDANKLTSISLLIFLFSIMYSFLFAMFTWGYTVWTYRS
jgi:hypothetical protein